MAKAQQKPKKVAGTRNSDRRNGKAWRNNNIKQQKVTGKSIMGYKRSRVEKWAAEAGCSLEEYIKRMKAEREIKKDARRENRAAFGRLIKGSDKLYSDGTLVHKSMPRIPGQTKRGTLVVQS